MYDLIKLIRLGEDSTVKIMDLRYRGSQIFEPNRNSTVDEFAAMANTNNGVFILGVDDKTRFITGIPIDKLDVAETWIIDGG